MERLLLEAQTVQNLSFQSVLEPAGAWAAGAGEPMDSAGGGGGGGGVWGVVLPVFTRRGSYAMVGKDYQMKRLRWRFRSANDQTVGHGGFNIGLQSPINDF